MMPCAVLAAGGIGVNGIMASAELYKPSTGVWTSTSSLSDPREYFQMVLLPNGEGGKPTALTPGVMEKLRR